MAYTTGFSPHQIMSFAAPLGVGLESNGEYMDMEVVTFSGSKDTVTRLNANEWLVHSFFLNLTVTVMLPELSFSQT